MSNQSDLHGRSFEYACITVLSKRISEIRPARIIQDEHYLNVQNMWASEDESAKKLMIAAAEATIPSLFDLEPMLTDTAGKEILLSIQSDSEGEEGDVRDIVIRKSEDVWEIGISAKHNHFAVKHSRLSSKIDFADKWFGIPCTKQYWDDIRPIFDYLAKEKSRGTLWRDMSNKSEDVYIPLLMAFVNEMNRQNKTHGELIPMRMVEYLLSKFDFYKVIGIDAKRITEIMAFNLHGNLNKRSPSKLPKIIIPISSLPTRIIKIDFKPNSDNTVEMYLDNGWSFSFRIHNASTKVEPSLKFDIQFLGVPATIITINCLWR